MGSTLQEEPSAQMLRGRNEHGAVFEPGEQSAAAEGEGP